MWLKPLADRLYRWLRSDLALRYQAVSTQTDIHQTIKYIDNLADLDAELVQVEKAFQVSDDEGRRRLAQFQYVLKGCFPKDPYSPEYAAAQMQMYLALSGRNSYDPSINEHSTIDIQQAKRSPFPYSTHSPATVGEQLMAQGFLVRAMNLTPGARVVEFGPGWGNTTLHLAQMGYQVTAVEIEQDFVELIRRRADAIGVEVKLVNQDMAAFEPSDQFDAALFFESFHHCADHLRLLRNLDKLITPEGLVAFAAEPIAEFPHPWGFVRTDGLTLWSIRKWGWFEQGFDSSYFLRTLLFNGWSPRWFRDDISPLTSVIIARKSHGYYRLPELSLPPDEAATWSLSKSGHYFITTKSILSCDCRSRVNALEICLSNFATDERHATLIAGKATSHVKLPAHSEEVIVRIQPKDWQGQVAIASPDWNQPHTRGTIGDRTSGIAVHWLRLLKE